METTTTTTTTTSLESLQTRVEQLEVLRNMLQQRMTSLQDENAREMSERAKLVAENNFLKRQLAQYQAQQEQAQQPQPTLGHYNDGGVGNAGIDEENPQGRLQIKESPTILRRQELTSSTVMGSKRKKTPEEPHRPANLPMVENGDDVERLPSSSDDDDDDSDDESYGLPRKKAKNNKKRKEKPAKQQQQQRASSSNYNKDYDSTISYVYHCPVQGCTHKVKFPGWNKPPFDDHGNVNDQVPWPHEEYNGQISVMRKHMRTAHHNHVPESSWPPGFAMRDEGKTKKKYVKSATRTTATSEASVPKMYYYCSVKGCGKRFGFGKQVPPLNEKGEIDDQVEWPKPYFYGHIWHIRKHMVDGHPGIHAEALPPALQQKSHGRKKHSLLEC